MEDLGDGFVCLILALVQELLVDVFECRVLAQGRGNASIDL